MHIHLLPDHLQLIHRLHNNLLKKNSQNKIMERRAPGVPHQLDRKHPWQLGNLIIIQIPCLLQVTLEEELAASK